jgi:hypothetical protein
VLKFHNKNQKEKIDEKGKNIDKKFNDNCFICNKIACLVKGCKNKAQQSNPK